MINQVNSEQTKLSPREGVLSESGLVRADRGRGGWEGGGGANVFRRGLWTLLWFCIRVIVFGVNLIYRHLIRTNWLALCRVLMKRLPLVTGQWWMLPVVT